MAPERSLSVFHFRLEGETGARKRVARYSKRNYTGRTHEEEQLRGFGREPVRGEDDSKKKDYCEHVSIS